MFNKKLRGHVSFIIKFREYLVVLTEMRKTHETTPSLRVKRFIEGVIKTATTCLHEQFHFVNKHGFFVKNCSNFI